jgi:prepilin-type N-terminal cleavage/methylation domain-containing protein
MRKNGFTLIELIITIAIGGIIGMIAWNAFGPTVVQVFKYFFG